MRMRSETDALKTETGKRERNKREMQVQWLAVLFGVRTEGNHSSLTDRSILDDGKIPIGRGIRNVFGSFLQMRERIILNEIRNRNIMIHARTKNR